MDDSESLSASQRLLAASAGAMLTALVVTPFEVIKTRMQAREHGHQQEEIFPRPPLRPRPADYGVGELASCPRCGVWVLNNGLMEHTLTKHECAEWFAEVASRSSICGGSTSVVTEESLGVMLGRIARTEGLSGLYAGLGPTLVMAVPNTALYFTAYDELRKSQFFPEVIAPAASGASARVVAATCVAPFELARTQLQALNPQRRQNYFTELRKVVKEEGLFRSLFRGLAPTLWRDVPFSAVYWAAYEKTKRLIVEKRRRTSNHRHLSIAAAFGGGLTGGAIAAMVTTPFDVVKTRRMVELHTGQPAFAAHNNTKPSLGTFGLLWAIARTEGIAALFTGAVPRLLKVAPACAIMIGTYEYSKALFLRNTADDQR